MNIWLTPFLYFLFPVLCVAAGIFFIAASVLVGSKSGVVLSTVVLTYGTMVLCWRHSR